MAMSGIFNISKLPVSSLNSFVRQQYSSFSNRTSTKIDSRCYSWSNDSLLQQLECLQSHVREDQSHMNHIEKAKAILKQQEDPLESMKTIDSLQRLGIDYHFQEEIADMLCSVYTRFSYMQSHLIGDLFEVTLSFRLLRQAGHRISSDVLYKFVDEKGQFDRSLGTDTNGLLSLYEASFLNMGEDILYRAKEFTSEYLTHSTGNMASDHVQRLVRRTLKHPFHRTLPRYSAPFHITQCEETSTTNGALRNLARVDFNRVQSLYQRELVEILRWWKDTSLTQELSFIRDQPLKWYVWPMTVIPDPKFSKCRIELTKVIAFVYIIDDIFDVYGSFEDLLLFTQGIRKWDLSVVETLPTHMQLCYITLYNITNEIAQTTHVEHGFNPINHLKESWSRLCDAFLKESKWFHSNQVPKADEYLRNAIVTSGVYLVLTHVYFLLGQGITEENANFIQNNPTLLTCPATILRLWDDLGSAKDENQEGFDGSYVEYLMKEHLDYSMEGAKDHVMKIISALWENMNKECFLSSHFAPDLAKSCLNVARMVEVMYSYENNENLPILGNYMNTLLFKSI